MNGNRVQVQTLVPFLASDTGRTDLNDMLDVIAEWCLESERLIGTKRWLDEVKPNSPNGLPMATIHINNYRGLLPKDYYDCDDIQAWCTNQVCICGQTPCTCLTCGCGWSVDTVWGSGCGCGFWNYYQSYRIDDFSIQGCYLVSPFRTGSAKIHYYAIPLDETGYPLILQSHRNAIRAYCLYQLNTANYINKKIDRGVYKDLENRWFELCAIARGNDNLPSRQAMGRAASLNNNPYKISPGYGGYGNGYNGGSWW